MNTGIHDASNLGWKLSMVLDGLASPSLLNTYESERLPNVQKLITYDEDISRLMTMQLPVGWAGDPNADPNEILGTVMDEASTFTSGLSIAFELNVLNVRRTFESIAKLAPVSPGQRGPDVQLQKPGTNEATRLHKETPNNARFHVVVFAGEPDRTSGLLGAFAQSLEVSKIFMKMLDYQYIGSRHLQKVDHQLLSFLESCPLVESSTMKSRLLMLDMGLTLGSAV
jgi:phenol 2-monooxygenase